MGFTVQTADPDFGGGLAAPDGRPFILIEDAVYDVRLRVG